MADDSGIAVGHNGCMPSSSPRRADVPRNLKPYFLCLLKKGPRWNITEGHEDLMPKYLAWLHGETEARRIFFAGPVTDNGDLIGMAILEAASAAEAAAFANANPGIESGHFLAELHPCYLPALDAVRVEY
ncbi:MAG TPA: YciI family protein [Alloacidobacterium sp.]|nr:YciI family protein [Alloacidobacterium sp.]